VRKRETKDMSRLEHLLRLVDLTAEQLRQGGRLVLILSE
jgi:hypothetical protein